MSRATRLAAAGAVLCAVATAFAAPELYVPGVSLLLVATVAPGWVAVAAAGVRVQLSVPAARAVAEGDRVGLTVRVARRGWPFPGATLVLGPHDEPLALPPRQRVAATTTSIAMHRRGRHTLGPARLVVRDPLGICSREITSDGCEILVLPRVHPMSAAASGGLDGEVGARAAMPRGADEIDGLRPYQRGAPAARIHWPTVARSGELIEHRLAADAEQRPLVVLDARQAQSADALDRAVRATASLCVHLARRGGCALLLPGDRRAVWVGPDLRGWATQHARLALVEPTATPPAPAPVRRAGTVVWVTAAEPGSADAPAGGWRLGPRSLPGVAVAFTVAGCDAQRTPVTIRARSA